MKENKKFPFERGCIAEQRYRIKLSPVYQKLYKEAADCRDSIEEALSRAISPSQIMRISTFQLTTRYAGEVDLNNATAPDAATLILYFTLRGKTLEDIFDHMKRERREVGEESEARE